VLAVAKEAKSGDHILVMSNGGFGGVHQKILKAIAS
jgi:UDP-N-acetylmuramate: L-alanyl-gamma-D-glutamyl-meso-diaminopimelate ligase